MFGQLSLYQKFLVLHETIMHLPVLALLTRTAGGFRRLESLGVEAFDRKVFEEIADLVGLDIVRNNLRQGVVCMLAAIWALVVAEFHDRNARLWVAH